jgi:hypothetical protein
LCSIKNEIVSPISKITIIRPLSSFFEKQWDFVEAEAAWLLVWEAVAVVSFIGWPRMAVAVHHVRVCASPMAARPTASKSFNSRNLILTR